MDVMRQIDIYCERMGHAFWAEPVNAVSNGAFLLAAVIMWLRAPHPVCRALSAVLAVIGVGSFLFHTHGTVWAMIADVVPIGVFILGYIWAAHRLFWGLSRVWAGITALASVPLAALMTPVFGAVPFFEISAGYWPMAVVIALEAWLLRNRLPRVAFGMAVGAGVLVASLTARSVDMAVCAAVPVGTHFLWHLLNGFMLGWMIEVLRRHLAEQPSAG